MRREVADKDTCNTVSHCYGQLSTSMTASRYTKCIRLVIAQNVILYCHTICMYCTREGMSTAHNYYTLRSLIREQLPASICTACRYQYSAQCITVNASTWCCCCYCVGDVQSHCLAHDSAAPVHCRKNTATSNAQASVQHNSAKVCDLHYHLVSETRLAH
jgi:hypothetical protein